MQPTIVMRKLVLSDWNIPFLIKQSGSDVCLFLPICVSPPDEQTGHQLPLFALELFTTKLVILVILSFELSTIGCDNGSMPFLLDCPVKEDWHASILYVDMLM